MSKKTPEQKRKRAKKVASKLARLRKIRAEKRQLENIYFKQSRKVEKILNPGITIRNKPKERTDEA